MEDKKTPVRMSGKFGVELSAYEIKQEEIEGTLTLHLRVFNPTFGDYAAYAKFLSDFEAFLDSKGY